MYIIMCVFDWLPALISENIDHNGSGGGVNYGGRGDVKGVKKGRDRQSVRQTDRQRETEAEMATET